MIVSCIELSEMLVTINTFRRIYLVTLRLGEHMADDMSVT